MGVLVRWYTFGKEKERQKEQTSGGLIRLLICGSFEKKKEERRDMVGTKLCFSSYLCLGSGDTKVLVSMARYFLGVVFELCRQREETWALTTAVLVLWYVALGETGDKERGKTCSSPRLLFSLDILFSGNIIAIVSTTQNFWRVAFEPYRARGETRVELAVVLVV